MFFNERVYLRPGHEFFENWPMLNLESLIKMVAKAKQVDENDAPLIDMCGHACLRRTKRYILRQANQFISGFDVSITDGVDMKKTITITQFNLLIRAFKHQKRLISAHSLILFHIMIQMLDHTVGIAPDENVQLYIDAINILARQFIQEFPNHPLAYFLIECYAPVQRELNDPNALVSLDDFPSIPRSREDESDGAGI